MNEAIALKIPLRLARIPQSGHEIRITATEKEREALKTFHELAALDSFTVRLKSAPSPKGVELKGYITADLAEYCVVTHEPLPRKLETEFVVRFVKKPSIHGEEIEFSALEDDEEPYPGDEAEVGGIVEEYFTLALEPYPRKEGVHFEHIEDDAPEVSPFAALKSAREEKTDKS